MEQHGGSGGRLVLVCGLPGAGKTTVARTLEADLGALRLCPDEWMAELGIDLFDGDARGTIEARQWEVAHAVLRAGGAVVIEWGLWRRWERDRLRDAAREVGASVELRSLDVPFEVLWERVSVRDEAARHGARPIERAELAEWFADFEAPDAAEVATYDSVTGSPS
jgi:predicted kinase